MESRDLIGREVTALIPGESESILAPGSIQPHGLLLVLSEPDFEIGRVSENTGSLLGIESDRLLGTGLARWIEPSHLEAIRSCIRGDFDHINPLNIPVYIEGKTILFDGIVHRSPQDKIILELEPYQNRSPNYIEFYQKIKIVLNEIKSARSLQDLSDSIARKVRQITGFDRVTIYRFDGEGSGVVIAEDRAEELETYLHLHYPAFDIPERARDLFAIHGVRLIPDVDYRPARIFPGDGGAEPLDLSYSGLRGVSPCHLQYMRNMGMKASMSISLVREGRLWGLIACHHRTRRLVPYEARTFCEFLGQLMSLELISKEENENLEARMRVKSIRGRFIDALSRSSDFIEVFVENPRDLLDLVGAEGAVLVHEGQPTSVGKTPDEKQTSRLIDWLKDKFRDNVFVTDSLPRLYPPSATFRERACGLLALSITKLRPNYILWFRPEIVQQVDWAGDPRPVVEISTEGIPILSPRKSFRLWQEIVRGKSFPWQSHEIEGALELRGAIVGIIVRKADELAAINGELERSNQELDAFAYIASHDLKEPLRGIHNYSTFLREDYRDILEADGVEKLDTLIRLTKRMEDLIDSLLHFSRLGRQELRLQVLNLDRIVEDVSEVLRMSYGEGNIEIRAPRSLPPVRGDRVLIEEVLLNLIGNGIKYNTGTDRRVEIGYLDPGAVREDDVTFFVRDNGIGIREKHLESIFRIFKRLHAPGTYGGGTGAGLTIVKKIIERHGGKIWVESVYGSGSTFYFTLPRGEG
jgi:light-regulated signal transduction histidine kinase (bacteriophytochrome)